MTMKMMWAMFLLLLIGECSGTADICMGKNKDIKKFFTIANDGWIHCVFIHPDYDSEVKEDNNFSLHTARIKCSKYNAVVIQFPNKIMYTDLVNVAKGVIGPQNPDSQETYHPLGIKSQTITEKKTGQSVDSTDYDLTIGVTWNSGKKSVINTIKFFPTSMAGWISAERDDITFFSVLTGGFVTEKPEDVKSEVALVCHQDPDNPNLELPKDDYCIKDTKVRTLRLYINGKPHCVFYAFYIDIIERIKDKISGFKFNLSVLQERCEMFGASLLEIPDNETHAALVKDLHKLEHTSLIVYPLGIKKKEVLIWHDPQVATQPPQPDSIKVTWDNGKETYVQSGSAYDGEMLWEVLSANGVAFLTLPSGKVVVQDPKTLPGRLVLMCDQAVSPIDNWTEPSTQKMMTTPSKEKRTTTTSKQKRTTRAQPTSNIPATIETETTTTPTVDDVHVPTTSGAILITPCIPPLIGLIGLSWA